MAVQAVALIATAAVVLGALALILAALARARRDPHVRRTAALAAGTVVALAMLAIAVAVAVYAIGLSTDASSLAGESTGRFQVLSVIASLLIQLVVTVGAGALALLATVGGWCAESQLAAT
jgi:hypothetical protein